MMIKSFRTAGFAFILIIILTLSVYAQSVPSIPALCYGELTIDGQPAPVGTLVVAKVENVEKGSLVTDKEGWYGGPGLETKLAVQTDGSQGKYVSFYISGTMNGVEFEDVYAGEELFWGSGETKKIDLSIEDIADTSGVILSAGSKTGLKGSNVTVNINIDNAKDTEGGQLDLLFDPELVEPLSAEQGTFIPDAEGNFFDYNLNFEEGKLRVAWVLAEGAEVNSGTIIRINFKLLDEGKSDLNFSNVHISPEGVVIEKISSGSLTAIKDEVVKGDITGNGEINVQDAVLVMRYILNNGELSDRQKLAADVNNDGVVNIHDVVLIVRYALGLIDSF